MRFVAKSAEPHDGRRDELLRDVISIVVAPGLRSKSAPFSVPLVGTLKSEAWIEVLSIILSSVIIQYL